MRISPLWLTFLRRFGISCGVVLLISGIAVQFGNRVEQNTFNATRKIHIPSGVLTQQPPGKPANYLLIGVDSRAATDAGSNSDVMMVLHVEPATQTGFLVSFPRDLLVHIPGYSGQRQLNAAYALGGPVLTIKTFEQVFKPLTIQHYIEVDFSGFQDIVNAIGHVNIWFPTPVHDPYIGLNVDHAGCVAMNGTEALAYERSRHYYVPDNLQNPAPWQWDYPAQSGGRGWNALGSDTGRIPRQQYLLRTIAQAALNKTASNPTKLFGLLDAVQNHFAHDGTLKLSELKQLIRAFNGLDPTKVEMTTLPWQVAPDGNRLLVKYPDATPVIDRLASLPPPPSYIPTASSPSRVRVRVVNGTGQKGLAAKVLSEFLAAGFKSGGPPADADRSDYAETQVRYAPGHGGAGVTAVIATGTTHLSEALSLKDTLGGDILVIVGRDWDSLKHHFPTATTTTQPGVAATPTSTTASTTTTTVPKTTTTLNPFLPVDPKTGGTLTGCPKI